MSDYSELKRLAESAPEGPWFGPEYAPNTGYVFDNCLGSLLRYESIEYEQEACLRYVASANPAAVLSLIAKVERLADGLKDQKWQFDQLNHEREMARDQIVRLEAENEALTRVEAGLREMLHRQSKEINRLKKAARNG